MIDCIPLCDNNGVLVDCIPSSDNDGVLAENDTHNIERKMIVTLIVFHHILTIKLI